ACADGVAVQRAGHAEGVEVVRGDDAVVVTENQAVEGGVMGEQGGGAPVDRLERGRDGGVRIPLRRRVVDLERQAVGVEFRVPDVAAGVEVGAAQRVFGSVVGFEI